MLDDLGTGNTQTFSGALQDIAVGYMAIIPFENSSPRISNVSGNVIMERGTQFDGHGGCPSHKYGTGGQARRIVTRFGSCAVL